MRHVPASTKAQSPAQAGRLCLLWSTLEIARTCRAAEVAGGGAAHPACKMPNAAKPIR